MQDAARLLFQYADMCEPSQVTPSAKQEIGELVASIASNLIRTSDRMGAIVPK